MDDEDVFAIPVSFAWRVSRAGYSWTPDTTGRRVLCAADAAQGGWPNSLAYRPLERRTGLFHEFARLQPSETSVVAFANRFGLLEEGANLHLPSKPQAVRAHGETLEFWKSEIQTLRFAVELWDAFMSGNRNEIVGLSSARVTERFPLALRQRLNLVDLDAPQAALEAIQDLTDDKLRRHVETRLLRPEDSFRPKVFLVPCTLLGALWLQFAAAVDARKVFIECQQCGAPFELSRAPGSGKRSDARFCTDRCRVAHHRQRVEQARRMKSQGSSPAQIARKLKTDTEVVKGWLRTAE